MASGATTKKSRDDVRRARPVSRISAASSESRSDSRSISRSVSISESRDTIPGRSIRVVRRTVTAQKAPSSTKESSNSVSAVSAGPPRRTLKIIRTPISAARVAKIMKPKKPRTYRDQKGRLRSTKTGQYVTDPYRKTKKKKKYI